MEITPNVTDNTQSVAEITPNATSVAPNTAETAPNTAEIAPNAAGHGMGKDKQQKPVSGKWPGLSWP